MLYNAIVFRPLFAGFVICPVGTPLTFAEDSNTITYRRTIYRGIANGGTLSLKIQIHQLFKMEKDINEAKQDKD